MLEDSSRFDDSDDSSIVLFSEPEDDVIVLSSDEDKTTSKSKPLVFTPTKAVKTESVMEDSKIGNERQVTIA